MPAHGSPSIAPGLDDDQERSGSLLLLGEGEILAHRLARPLAAELEAHGTLELAPGHVLLIAQRDTPVRVTDTAPNRRKQQRRAPVVVGA